MRSMAQAYLTLRLTCSDGQTDSFRVDKPCDGEAIRQDGTALEVGASKAGSLKIGIL